MYKSQISTNFFGFFWRILNKGHNFSGRKCWKKLKKKERCCVCQMESWNMESTKTKEEDDVSKDRKAIVRKQIKKKRCHSLDKKMHSFYKHGVPHADIHFELICAIFNFPQIPPFAFNIPPYTFDLFIFRNFCFL